MKSTIFAPEILRPYDVRHVPLPPPDTAVTDAPFVRLCINSKWVSHVDGLIERLLYRDAWSGLDADIETAIQQVRVLLALLGATPTEDCDIMLQFEPLEDGCGFQFSVDGGVTWNPVVLPECVGIQGEQGETGETGPQGETGETGAQGPQGVEGPPGQSGTTSNPPGDPPGPDGDDKRCSVARGVSQWTIEKYSDSIDFLQASFEAAQSIAAAVSGLIDAIPVVGAFIDAAIDFATELKDYDLVNLKACITEEFEDEVFCLLYCRLEADGVVTDDIFNAWVADVALIAPCLPFITLVGQGLALNLLAIGAQNVRNRAYIFATDSTIGCPPCDDCPAGYCYKWDFEISDHDWQIHIDPQERAAYFAGDGWKESPERDDRVTIKIEIDLTNATEIEVGVDSCDGITNIGIGQFDGSGLAYVACSDNKAVRTVAWPTANGIIIDAVFPSSTNPTIKYVIIRGTGENPIGADNCE